MSESLQLHTKWGTTETVELVMDRYATYGNLCLSLYSREEGPYCGITVNIERLENAYQGYVDTNNMPEIETFLMDNQIGQPVQKDGQGVFVKSGFCTYPLYQFDKERLIELLEIEFE